MQPSADHIWSTAQEQLRSLLTSDTYNLWFAPLRACAQDHNSIVLEVADDFCEVWLKDNYLSLLQQVLAVASGRHLQVRFKVSDSAGSVPASPPTASPKVKHTETLSERNSAAQDLNFNPKNTFDTF